MERDNIKTSRNDIDDKKIEALNRFYENLGDSTSDLFYYLHPIGLERRKKILDLVNPSHDDTVCELGCGDGYICGTIVGKVQSVTGVDISKTRIDRARRKGIKAFIADASSTSLPSGSFTKIICSEVIEHLVDPNALLREIWRLLAPHGIAVISVPLQEDLGITLLDIPNDDLHNLTYDELQTRYNLKDSHISAFTVETFVNLIRICGFEIDKLDYTHEYELKKRFYKVFISISRVIQNISIPILSKTHEYFYSKLVFYLYRRLECKHHALARIYK